MHGIVFSELKKYVEERLGADHWAAMLEAAGRPGKLYLVMETYPDQEALTLVAAAAQALPKRLPLLLEELGERLAPRLMQVYGSSIDPEWTALDLIEHTESVIHQVVRRRHQGAAPPTLSCRRESPSRAVIAYASDRKMCGLAKGIIRGVARHYQERVLVRETQCMLKGGVMCEIVVKRVE